MRAIKLTFGLALVLALVGCDYVASKHPVGEAPLALEEEDWEGVWLHVDGPVTVRVVDAEQGLLEIAWVEDRHEGFELESVGVELRQYGGWTFANFAGVDDFEDLLWSRFERNGREIFLWWPRPEAFKRLIEADLLPGTLDEDNVTLGQLEPEHLAIIVSEQHGVLFEWDQPMSFQRVK